jgi:pimeloyl-ACP methyl ester carboxylesterase
VPAISLWGQDDPILRVEWQETLPDVFSDITLQQAPGAGHFVAWEAPALANQAIKDFFIDRR